MDIELIVPLVLSSMTLVGMTAIGFSRGALSLGPISSADTDALLIRPSQLKEEGLLYTQEQIAAAQHKLDTEGHYGNVLPSALPLEPLADMSKSNVLRTGNRVREHGWFAEKNGTSSMSCLLFILFYKDNPLKTYLLNKTQKDTDTLLAETKKLDGEIKELNKRIKYFTTKIEGITPELKPYESEESELNVKLNKNEEELVELSKRLNYIEKTVIIRRTLLKDGDTISKKYAERLVKDAKENVSKKEANKNKITKDLAEVKRKIDEIKKRNNEEYNKWVDEKNKLNSDLTIKEEEYDKAYKNIKYNKVALEIGKNNTQFDNKDARIDCTSVLLSLFSENHPDPSPREIIQAIVNVRPELQNIHTKLDVDFKINSKFIPVVLTRFMEIGLLPGDAKTQQHGTTANNLYFKCVTIDRAVFKGKFVPWKYIDVAGNKKLPLQGIIMISEIVKSRYYFAYVKGKDGLFYEYNYSDTSNQLQTIHTETSEVYDEEKSVYTSAKIHGCSIEKIVQERMVVRNAVAVIYFDDPKPELSTTQKTSAAT